MTIVFLSDGQSAKRSFAFLAFDDGICFLRNNGGKDSAKAWRCFVDDLFRDMTEECIVVRRPGQVYRDCRYAVTDHPNREKYEK